MKKRPGKGIVILAVLLSVNLLATGWLLFGTLRGAGERAERFVLYIGTSDKDTGAQEIPLAECLDMAKTVCMQYVPGCTIWEARGAWTDADGAEISENTLVCVVSGATDTQIDNIAADLREALNQQSILIERQTVSARFDGD